MNKEIPIYFDSVVISSPIQESIGDNSQLSRLKVRVFTRYENRNGSYITDKVAQQLIDSATNGNTPVVGFFDSENQSWASHTNPSVANGYGYVENFLGWEPYEDSDGIIRDYAVFSVVLFTNYYEEARKIYGQNQSMELNPKTITGSWTTIGDKEYYVYDTAEMLGFCVIGSHEPCFSVSSFFSKNDNEYKSQYEKFSILLSELKERIQEIEKETEGGQQMEEINEKVETTQEEIVVEPAQENTEIVEEEQETASLTVEEPAAPTEDMKTAEEFAALLERFNELKNSFAALQETTNATQASYEAIKVEMDALRTENENLKNVISNYEKKFTEIETVRKNELIKKYEKNINEEEISGIRSSINDFSYDELESKLAIIFANYELNKKESNSKVPLVQPDSQFASFMERYRK